MEEPIQYRIDDNAKLNELADKFKGQPILAILNDLMKTEADIIYEHFTGTYRIKVRDFRNNPEFPEIILQVFRNRNLTSRLLSGSPRNLDCLTSIVRQATLGFS